MISSLAFLPVRGVALPILMGLGKPRTPTIAFILAGLANLVLSIALARPLGLAGVALGTAIPNVAVRRRRARRRLPRAARSASATYLRYVVPRAALGAIPPLALLLWFKLGDRRRRTSPGLVAAGAAMVVLFGLTWVFFVYRDDPYVDAHASTGPSSRVEPGVNRAHPAARSSRC